MRVLHVIDSLSASGGAEHGLVREAIHLSSEVDQRVVRIFTNDALDSRLSGAGIRVVGFDMDSSSAGRNWPVASHKLGKVVAEFEPDVIQSSLFAANLAAQLTARRKKIPILSTFTLSGDPKLLRAYQPGAESWKATALRRIAGVLARSELVRFRALTRDALETNCRLLGVDPGRASVIPRGIPEDSLPDQPLSREDLGLPQDLALVVNVGRQTAQKGHVDLVETFRRIREEFPAHLVILGRQGDATPALKKAIAESRFQDDISVVDYTPHIFDYLSHASVFVFPSLMEGLGTAVLEAMMSGVPVVAYDIPPLREVTNGGRLARLVPVGDIGRLTSATVDVLRNNQTMKPVAAASKWVLDSYGLTGVADQVERLLFEVASLG